MSQAVIVTNLQQMVLNISIKKDIHRTAPGQPQRAQDPAAWAELMKWRDVSDIEITNKHAITYIHISCSSSTALTASLMWSVVTLSRGWHSRWIIYKSVLYMQFLLTLSWPCRSMTRAMMVRSTSSQTLGENQFKKDQTWAVPGENLSS